MRSLQETSRKGLWLSFSSQLCRHQAPGGSVKVGMQPAVGLFLVRAGELSQAPWDSLVVPWAHHSLLVFLNPTLCSSLGSLC